MAQKATTKPSPAAKAGAKPKAKPKKKATKAKPKKVEQAAVVAPVAAAAAPAPLLQRGGGGAIARSALEKLRKDGPFTNYTGGFWAKPNQKIVAGRPVGSIPAFVVEVLVRNQQAEFTKFKSTRGGKIPTELRAI